MQRLGNLSFSVYLTNEVIFDTVRVIRYALGLPIRPKNVSATGVWLWCFGWLALVFVISALTYRFVEVPARNYINHRFGHRQQAYPVDSVVTKVPR